MTETLDEGRPTDLTAVALACTLKRSFASSTTVQLASELLDAMAEEHVRGELVRVVDHDVHPGVEVDEGDGDEWPEIREKVLAADILVMATPVWVGQPSSVCKRVLERLDAELGRTDDRGRTTLTGKAAAVAVVGQEDGAHHTVAEVLQALHDVGLSVAGQGSTTWVGEAVRSTRRGAHGDDDESPELTQQSTRTAASATVHLARLLRAHPYPGVRP